MDKQAKLRPPRQASSNNSEGRAEVRVEAEPVDTVERTRFPLPLGFRLVLAEVVLVERPLGLRSEMAPLATPVGRTFGIKQGKEGCAPLNPCEPGD